MEGVIIWVDLGWLMPHEREGTATLIVFFHFSASIFFEITHCNQSFVI